MQNLRCKLMKNDKRLTKNKNKAKKTRIKYDELHAIYALNNCKKLNEILFLPFIFVHNIYKFVKIQTSKLISA